MTNRNEDAFMDGLFRRALVPKGFRPRTEEGVDEVLRALGQVEVSNEERQRVVEKIFGLRPCNKSPEAKSDYVPEQLDSRSEELVEMFRGEGEDVPPEIAERLQQLENEAAQEPDDDEADNPDGP